MEESQKHPTDDNDEVGSTSTAGELYGALERYAMQKRELLEAEERVKRAGENLLEKQVALRAAKLALTNYIFLAAQVTRNAEDQKASLTSAPAIELPMPGIQYTDPFEANPEDPPPPF